MNRSDIDYIVDKLNSYKPDNVYDGYNGEKEKQDQRVSEVLDSIISEIERDYENGNTPMPKELLKNGVFGKTNEDKWFVFVDGMFVYEDGNYDIIEDINENLIFCYKGSIRPVNVLVKSNCFKNAKLNFKLNKDVIWRR